METVNITSNVISLLVYFDPSHMQWLLNLVYCLAPYRKKQQFWDLLTNITNSFSDPSPPLEDFNSILTHSEKISGKLVAQSSNPKGLKLFMETFGFVD